MTENTQHEAQVKQLASDLSALMEWANVNAAGPDERDKIRLLVTDWVGAEAIESSVVARELSCVEHVNVQAALDAWSGEPGRSVQVHGVYIPRNYGGGDLMSLLSGHGAPARLVSPAMTDLPNGHGSTLACYDRALFLVRDSRGAYVIHFGLDEHSGDLRLEVAGLAVQQAQGVLDELDALRDALDVHRGGVLQVRASPSGGVALEFLDPAPMARERLILPDATLERIEQHTVGIAEHRDELLAAGQHLKRGVLLYGPPGTGKTHTIRYVLGQMSGYTRLIMQGAALHAIGPAAALARRLAPAVVVLEDVDLVAQDRSYEHGDNPILFELLDAMDGAAADSDLLFILTTNRAEVLERALAARPGRVDVAVEVQRPDADARRRLFELYAAHANVVSSPELLDEVMRRTDGVTASFLKELVRRCVLEALKRGEGADVVADDVRHALDDMLDDAQHVTRALLGSRTPAQA